MAVQANGITVVRVLNNSRVIQFFVGSIDIALRYEVRRNRFRDVYRSYIDNRRTAEFIEIPDIQYRDMIRQAHAIARSHGWKQL